MWASSGIAGGAMIDIPALRASIKAAEAAEAKAKRGQKVDHDEWWGPEAVQEAAIAALAALPELLDEIERLRETIRRGP